MQKMIITFDFEKNASFRRKLRSTPGANPTILSYNARIVKNATLGVVRFENKNIFF
jgi:hypothetical protein